MRVNMYPEIMTSDVKTVPVAQVQRFLRMGDKKRRVAAKSKAPPPKSAQRAQSIGAL